MRTKKLSAEQKKTRLHILKISYYGHYAHIGSCLTAVDIINATYKVKSKDEHFILSNGHAGVALYVVLIKNKLMKQKDLKGMNIHPDRNPKLGIHVSTGSLGQGLPIALGVALADRRKNVYCMISDGESTEGSIWEALRIAADQKVKNLKILLNANGWGAYQSISLTNLLKRLRGFNCQLIIADGHNIQELVKILRNTKSNKPLIVFAKTIIEQLPFLQGQAAHYHIMSKKDYQLAQKALK